MLMNDLLKTLVERKGSDLHIKAGLRPAIRLNGEITPLDDYPALTPEAARELVFSVIDEEQKARFEIDPEFRFELDFAYGVPGVGRFRFNVHRQRGTIGAVVRSLATSIPSLEKLNLPEAVIKFTTARKGLALVTGPTGSGKSTTLAAIIDKINETHADHILTIEDPIEYVHNSKRSYVTQREVGDSADTLSFKNALKYALRQDPDVILIGEMRDHETIGIAITSAETGHLVFGTLHTSSAAQTIGRIIDVFPADQQEQVKTQLAGNFVGVLAQILLPKADGKGRVCACEIMFATPAVRNNIRMNNAEGIYQSLQTGSNEGMQTMDQALTKLVRSGQVTFEAARPFMRDDHTVRALASYAESHVTAAAGPVAAAPVSTSVPAPARVAEPAEPAPAPAEEPRRRLGGIVIPPWEKRS
jgi:twitching motility protein PilT